MGRRRDNEQVSGKITFGITKNALVLAIVDFVFENLPAWRDHPDRPYGESEHELNPSLCKFLGWQAQTRFPMVSFQREEPQVRSRTVDLAALPAEAIVIEAVPYSIFEPLVVFECKRLPAPCSEREREYVTSARADRVGGGIQRFKQGLHGAMMNLGVMIGYVQEHSLGEWHRTINEWICDCAQGGVNDGCTWGVGEKLIQFREDVGRGTSACKSVHERSSGGPIELRHLWVAMSSHNAR